MDTSVLPAAPPGRPAAVDARQYRAARQLCRQFAPELFFASHFLSRAKRHAVYSLLAVVRQIEQIIHHTAAPADPGADDDCALGEATTGCPSPQACAEGCAAGGESIEQRRAVCSAVLEYLYTGQKTGRPELDGFHGVAQHYQLPRDLFEQLADGLAAMVDVQRYATWQRLHEDLNRTAGNAALLAWRVLDGPGAPQPTSTTHTQVMAMGAAMRFSVILCRVGDDWRRNRLLLPLYDLVKFGLTERDVANFSDAGAVEDDVRWAELMAFELDRARNLYRGGGRCLGDIRDDSARRAAAVVGVIYGSLLDQLQEAGGDPFAAPIHTTLWSRLARMPRALRLAVNPQRAARVF